MSSFFIFLFSLAFTSGLQAQFDKPVKTKDPVSFQIPYTKDMENKLIEVVKPVRDQVEKLLKEDGSGRYQAYADEVGLVAKLKKPEEKMTAIKQIRSKYVDFIRKIWAAAKIDEPLYQSKIKNIFPPDIRETIQFGEFLTFTSSSKTRNHQPPPPPPPPSPTSPTIKCIDGLSLFFGYSYVSPSLIAKGSSMVMGANLLTDAVAEVAGLCQSQGAVLSNINIPGTFPDDNKLLRVKKSYTWNAYAFAISVIGCSFTSISHATDNSNDREFTRVWAPVIFISSINRNELVIDEMLIQKKFMQNIRYGMMAYCDAFSELISSSTSGSNCFNITWNVCEEL